MFILLFIIFFFCINFEVRGMIIIFRLILLLIVEFYCGDIVCEKGGMSWVCGFGLRYII